MANETNNAEKKVFIISSSRYGYNFNYRLYSFLYIQFASGIVR